MDEDNRCHWNLDWRCFHGRSGNVYAEPELGIIPTKQPT